MSELRIFEQDPSAELEAVFQRIFDEQMHDLPIINDKLRVEAIGFERWNSHWLGMLITPWFLNLILVPGQTAGWPQIAEGEKLRFGFESGTYLFSAMDVDGFGRVMSCSLASPVREFQSQEMVRDTARDVMKLINQTPENERGAAINPAGDLQHSAVEEGCAMSRRTFLRGRIDQSAQEA